MQKNKTSESGHSSLIFSVLLFFVFLLCTLFTLLIGSRVYRNIRARSDRAFCTDTALAYVSNKVRQSDRLGAVRVANEDGTPVLILSQEGETGIYETWIYSMDGSLRELYAKKDSGLSVADGLEILECGPLSFTLEDTPSGGRLLTAVLSDGGTETLLLRSGEKGGNRP